MRNSLSFILLCAVFLFVASVDVDASSLPPPYQEEVYEFEESSILSPLQVFDADVPGFSHNDAFNSLQKVVILRDYAYKLETCNEMHVVNIVGIYKQDQIVYQYAIITTIVVDGICKQLPIPFNQFSKLDDMAYCWYDPGWNFANSSFI